MRIKQIKAVLAALIDAVSPAALATGLFVAASMAVIYAGVINLNFFEINAPDGEVRAASFSDDPATVLAGCNIEYSGEEFISVSYPAFATCDIDVHSGSRALITADGQSAEVVTMGATVAELLGQAGITLGELDTVSKPLNAYIDTDVIIDVDRVTVETVTYEEVLPPVIIDNSDPDSDIPDAVIEGREGLRRITAFRKYINGALAETTLLAEEVLESPGMTYIYTPSQTADAPSGDAPFDYSEVLIVEATAYTHTGNTTATGTWPAWGCVAVDPQYIPLGTKMYIESLDGSWVYGFATAQDTGGAIKGYIIDLFMETYDECILFGRRNIRVYILD